MMGADTGAMRRSATRMAASADDVTAAVGRGHLSVEQWRWNGPDADNHLQAARSAFAAARRIAGDLDRLAVDVRRQAADQDRVSR